LVYIKASRRSLELYGVSGRKGHGKDTFANLVLEANKRQSIGHMLDQAPRRVQKQKTFTVTHFADGLKRIALRIFRLKEAQMYDGTLKEIPFTSPIDMDMYLPLMRLETGLDIQSANKVAHSPREIMQFFGTDYVRRAQDDYWIRRLLVDVQDNRRVLIPDTRFPNEAEAIKTAGGRIIKIVRVGMLDNSTHPSETEIDKINPDLLLYVRTGDLSLPQRIATLISLGKFKAAQKYDYRIAKPAMESYASGKSAEDSVHLLGLKSCAVLYTLLNYYGIPIRKGAGPLSHVPHRIENGVSSKLCSECNTWNPLTDFNATSKSWDGLTTRCRLCASIYNKGMYEKYNKVDSMEAVFTVYQKGAKYTGRQFDLSLTDFKRMWEQQNGLCWYSGIPMTTTVKDPNKVSIDRVDSSKGYTLENTVLCTKRVNLMKREMSVEEFHKLVVTIYEWRMATPTPR